MRKCDAGSCRYDDVIDMALCVLLIVEDDSYEPLPLTVLLLPSPIAAAELCPVPPKRCFCSFDFIASPLVLLFSPFFVSPDFLVEHAIDFPQNLEKTSKTDFCICPACCLVKRKGKHHSRSLTVVRSKLECFGSRG